jgi:hypothetical protein
LKRFIGAQSIRDDRPRDIVLKDESIPSRGRSRERGPTVGWLCNDPNKRNQMEFAVNEAASPSLSTAPQRLRAKVPVPVRAAQAIMLLPLGALVVFGAIYFGFIHQLDNQTFWSYAVGTWALAQGVLSVYLAIKLSSGREIFRKAAFWVIGAHVLFGIVKLVFWQETEALSFVGFDLAVIALLSLRRTRAFFQ